MKSFYFYGIFALILVLFSSCKNDITNMGSSIQPEDDKIQIDGEAFGLVTGNYYPERIYNRPDSFLLGKYYSDTYGEVKADILTQFYIPFEANDTERFPKNKQNLTMDSIMLVLYYANWEGSEAAPMNVNVYEINLKSLESDVFYPSDVNADEYVNKNAPGTLLGERTFTAKDQLGEKDSTYIAIKLTDSFKDKMYQLIDSYQSEAEFLNEFKGLYITTNLGNETVIHVSGVRVLLYYSYEENVSGEIEKFTNTVSISASTDVTKINRYEYNRNKTGLDNQTDYNFISSPGNIYTLVKIPVVDIREKINESIGNGKRIIINNAVIKVKVEPEDESNDESALSKPTYMLLMAESQRDEFFTKRNTSPNDSVLFSSYSSTDSTYNFNLAALLTEKVKIADCDTLPMYLVPINAKIETNNYGSYVSEIKAQTSLTGVRIKGGQNATRPMKIRVIYSGF